MQLSPRYDGPPIIAIDGAPDDQLVPATRQRRRMESMLRGLDGAQWAAASRCDGWNVQDVVAHLIDVNAFWHASVSAGLAGTPTRMLATFDPVATPPAMVAAKRDLTIDEVLDQFAATNEVFLADLAGLDASGWAMPAESPAGHVPVRVLVFHALWDCWVHERDIALALGVVSPEEVDEVMSCLRYAAAVSPAFAISVGEATPGTFAVEADDPASSFVLDVGESVSVRDARPPENVPCLRGDAVALVEALSIRAPLPVSTPPEWRQMLGGIATVFDTVAL